MSTPAETHTFTTVEGFVWQVDLGRGRVSGSRLAASRTTTVALDFGARPLTDAALQYIWAHGSGGHASSIGNIAYALYDFCDLLHLSGRRSLSPETFSAFLDHLTDAGYRETHRRSAASHVKAWATTWLVSRGLASASDAIAIERRFKRHFRGFGRRHEGRLREQHVPAEEWVRLLRAVRMELDEARALLANPLLAPDHPAMPLMPFLLLAAGLLAVRPAEVNVMNVGDVRHANGEANRELKIYLHAPNKAPGELPLGDTLRAAWEVADAWMRRFRPAPQAGEPLLVLKAKEYSEPVRMDSLWINTVLRVFYRKYFKRLGRDGKPVLYSDRNGESSPFHLPFGQYRSAAITERARQERNPDKLRIFARHKSVNTTLSFYVRVAFLEYVQDVMLAYRAAAEQARAATPIMIATREERAAAVEAGAEVPGGVCGEALLGRPCPLSRNCMRCCAFKLHPDYRPYFVRELACEQRMAEAAVLDEQLKRDAQIHNARCALLQACIDRIDDFYDAMEVAT